MVNFFDGVKEIIVLVKKLIDDGVFGGYYDIGYYFEVGYGVK